MTSMPASRSARAMILAPRSWPSRPGLATTTRIFFSEEDICGRRDCSLVPPRRASRLPDDQRHLHALVDGADQRVRALPGEDAAVAALRLGPGAEVRRPTVHHDV